MSQILLGYFMVILAVYAEDQPCPQLDGRSPEAKLEFLKQDRARLDPTCITRALLDLGVGNGLKEQFFNDVILTMISYLDYRLPDRGLKYERVLSSNRDPYPASSALFIVGKRAVTFLVEAIAKAPLDSEPSVLNALNTLGAIYREDPPQAVRVLKSAAEGQGRNFEQAQRLRKAARNAVFCHGSFRQACISASYE